MDGLHLATSVRLPNVRHVLLLRSMKDPTEHAGRPAFGCAAAVATSAADSVAPWPFVFDEDELAEC